MGRRVWFRQSPTRPLRACRCRRSSRCRRCWLYRPAERLARRYRWPRGRPKGLLVRHYASIPPCFRMGQMLPSLCLERGGPMKLQHLILIGAATMIVGVTASVGGQSGAKRDFDAEYRAAVQSAKDAAGFEFLGTLVRTCLLPQ